MNGFVLAIAWLTGKKSSRALRVLGALLTAAAVVSTPLVAAGAPAAAGRTTKQAASRLDTAQAEVDALDAESLPAEEAVEEECAAEDEATAEACTEAEEATAASLPAEAAEGAPPPPAEESAVGAARVDDSFGVPTADGCGSATFIDYGPGNPGGGSNDDYILIQDICEDHHGVKAYAWRNGDYLGSKYLGGGIFSYKRWDPFPAGNVRPKDSVGIKVCLVDGSDDPTPFFCYEDTRRSEDG